MADSSNPSASLRSKFQQFFSSAWFWGVVAVVTTVVATSYVTLFLLSWIFAGIAIHQARFFAHATTRKRRRGGDAILFVVAGIVLSAIWWWFRPVPQPAAVTRAELQEELQKLKPSPNPSPSLSLNPTPTPSGSPSPSASRRQKKSASKSPRCSAEDRLLGRC